MGLTKAQVRRDNRRRLKSAGRHASATLRRLAVEKRFAEMRRREVMFLILAEADRVSRTAKTGRSLGPVHRPRLSWETLRARKIAEKSVTRTFRMDEKSFDDLLAPLRTNLERNADMAARATQGGRIEPAVRLAVVLRYLAGGSFLDLCDLYCCSWSTVRNSLGCGLRY